MLVSVSGLVAVVRSAQASSVHDSCTISRCQDARSANATWAAEGYPQSRGWNSWPGGRCNYAGGRYHNREGELPGGHTYYEYDVYPRGCGAPRDAYRIVVDAGTGRVWFSPNHYADFYRL